MFTKEFIRGTSVGFLIGVIVTGLALRKPIQEMLALDQKQLARRQDTINHMIATMGPYAPKDVLEELSVYLKFNLIVSNEEGKEMGMP